MRITPGANARIALEEPMVAAYVGGMDLEAPHIPSLDEMLAALDGAVADVVAGRVVSAREVHARLRRAITGAVPEQRGDA